MNEYLLTFQEWPFWLLSLCGLLLLIQLYFILFVHGKLAFHKVRSLSTDKGNSLSPGLSVVICTRNDEKRLAESLPKLLTQDYPNFEIVVVNDRSDDDTKWLLKDFCKKNDRLKVVEIAEHVTSQSGKKFGVAMGIKAAQYEHIVLTDVDCEPASDQWLKHLGAALSDKKQIVLGYSPLQRKSGFRNALIRFEHFIRSVDYLSRALKGQAYMGLGQNMAFRKSLFFEGKGYAAHMHIRAGHDELFVNQHANKQNTAIVVHKDAHVWKPMPKTFGDYQIQREFRNKASKLFQAKHRRRINTFAVTAVLFYVLLFVSLILVPISWPILLGFFGLRLITQLVIYSLSARKLRITRMIWFFPILDFLHTFYLGLRMGRR